MKSWITLALLLFSLQIFAQDTVHLASVLKQLDLKRAQCKVELLTTKTLPNNPTETIMVLPEIVEETEDYFELNSHVLILDNKTGEIKQRFFESSTTNMWFSDAIRLVAITIDTAPYVLSPNQQAFGIRVRYVGSSHANPYEKESLSLFVEEGDLLKQVLINLNVKQYNGQWDTDCAGEFNEQNSILIMLQSEGQAYADILVKTSHTYSQAFLNSSGDCLVEENSTEESRLLKYVNGVYE